MTERAATRSPMILIFRVSREAEIPTVNKAGTVPKPKANMVIAPSAAFSVMAALMSMEEVREQGRSPQAAPMAILEMEPGRSHREGRKRSQRDWKGME